MNNSYFRLESTKAKLPECFMVHERKGLEELFKRKWIYKK